MTLRFTPARFALSYIALGVAALALLAVPLWYGFQSNLGTFRSYIPAAEMQSFVDIFHRDGPKAVAAAVDAYAANLPPDQVALFVDPRKRRLAGNLPRWPAGVPDLPGTYGLVVERGGNTSTRVIVSNVVLPDGYVLLMGRESVIFDSLVARFWLGIAGAIAILLALGLLFGWLLRRAHGELEGLVAQRTAALRLSEERYAQVVLASNAGLWDYDVAKDEYYASPRFLELCGFPPERVFSGREDFRRCSPMHPDDAVWYEAAVKNLFAGNGTRLSADVRVIIGGEIHWRHLQGICLRDAEGKVVRWTGSHTDVTARKCAEESLQLSEERHARALQASNDGIWEWDPATDEVFISERARELWGVPAGAAVRTRTELKKVGGFHPEDLRRTEEVIAANRAPGGSGFDMEYRVIMPGGEVRWVRSQGKVFSRVDGGPAAVRMTGYITDITERKLASDALRASEERYSLAMDASEEGFVDSNLDTGEFVTSERLNEIFGIAPGTRFSSRSDFLKHVRFFGKDGETYAQTIRATEADGGPDRYQFEFRIMLPTSERRWIWTQGKVTRDTEGRARRRVGVVSDITARKCAEDALRVSEERYARAMEGSDAGHWDWNIVSEEMFVSERAREMLALPPGTLPKRRPEIMELVPVHPDDRARATDMVNAAMRSGIFSYDYRVIPAPGQVRWLRSRAKVYHDARGAAVRMTGSLSDITERKVASDALRASEERYSLAMDASEEAHFDVNVDADELFTSDRLNEIYGFPPGTRSIKRSEYLKDFRFYGNDAEVYHAAIRAAEAKGGPERYEFEFRMQRPAGEVRWLRTRGKVTRDAEGRARRRTGIAADITEAKLAEEELRAMERKLRQAQRLEAMGTLAGGIAHDFNNILGAILGFGEMALRDAPKGSRLGRDLDSIMEAGERGRALVDRVLAFSRSGVGERIPVHVEKVVREALDQLSAKLPPDITLHAKLHAGRAAMQGDATQVHQVLTNLATNAIQSMAGGGTLRVSLRVERIEQTRASTIGNLVSGEYFVLRVADTGTGISADVLEHMFDPFFTTKEVGTGTGLGLSIVHGIVTELGGAIDVATTLGAGSTFTIYLPRAGDAVETDLDEKPSLPRGDGQRVLVVDDEEPLVRLATRTLEELGYAPVGFTSSRAALAAFRADPLRFDAVITDERMPGMSGSALIREVRGIRDGIPVVLMSGYVGDAVARQAREAGVETVLRKPLSAHDLAASLARVLHA